ncbi:MAG: hypothetical protein JW863_23445 [Chitinispirillaceae bacterium]|nr:hypothetical protein [Chitinispirillaceae bacterium]
MPDSNQQDFLREIYATTRILRKPISGIISGYHELPYVLIAPNDENREHTVEINGTINVSPKFVISPGMLQETFGDVFDAGTFDSDIEGRMFSFAYSGKKNMKIESTRFSLFHRENSPEEYLSRMDDQLMRQENTRSGLIFCPHFTYYPVSIDRFINEILDREMRV